MTQVLAEQVCVVGTHVSRHCLRVWCPNCLLTLMPPGDAQVITSLLTWVDLISDEPLICK